MALALPKIMDFASCGKSQNDYLNDLYALFISDFQTNTTSLLGDRVMSYRDPITNGKEYTFNHITKLDDSAPGSIDYNRCKKIPWLSAILKSCPTPEVKCWFFETLYRKKTVTRLKVWYEAGNILLILQPKGSIYYLITSYTKAGQRNIDKLNREYTDSSTKLY